MIDTKIVGGTLADGTGGPLRRADIGIHEGRIVSIGDDPGPATTVIDATGHVVAPGFIDMHTHYDAQVMWDPAVTPSCFHGVTTVIGGNCGFTIAPVSADSRDYVMRMLACVEGMPVESLEEGLDWSWSSFGEWLDQIDGRLALNTAFSVGHSTVRRMVLGEDFRRPSTEAELVEMERLIDEALDAGAIGFSSSWGESHTDHTGQPVPSRHAEASELVRLSARLRDRPGTMLEFIPTVQPMFPDSAIDLMVDMSVTAGRPLNWNVVTVGVGSDRAVIERRLSASDRAAEKGGKIIALTVPIPTQFRLSLATTIIYNSLPGWPEVLSLPLPERIAALRDPEVRKTLAAAVEGKSDRTFMNFAAMGVEHVTSPELSDLVGRNLGEIADERGVDPFTVFLDIAVADDLQTTFITVNSDDPASWAWRAELWADPRTMVGASDAGAHLDMMATFGYMTDFVGPTVRDRGLLPLEEAVRLVTDVPARTYGLAGRGRVEEGWVADLVVFDPATVGTGTVVTKPDMPGGQARLYAEATGIEHVLVNGVEIVRQGELTDARPGAVLRGGRDTE
jgi:N-acyl-D-aspartate/D-glutamate deacylase